MNIIFLDLDGVIEFSYNEDIYINSVALLNKIANDYNAKIVLITSLLGYGTEARFKSLVSYLNKLGIYNVIDKIDVCYEGIYCGEKLSRRTLGIIDYLSKNKDIKYVIFDDDYNDQYEFLGLNYVYIDRDKGLTEENLKQDLFKEAKLNFENIYYQYRSLQSLPPDIRATNELIKVLKLIK